MANANDMWRMS